MQDNVTNIYSFLPLLSKEEFPFLYQNISTTLCVYKSLNKLGQYLLRCLLYRSSSSNNISTQVPSDQLEYTTTEELINFVKTTTSSSKKIFQETLNLLMNLCILEKSNNFSGNGSYSFCINQTFKVSILKSLRVFKTMNYVEGKEYTHKKLEKYAKKRWEKILLFMVGTSSYSGKKDIVKELIKQANLVTIQKDRKVSITSQGFQFLLLDLKSQIWRLLRQYMSSNQTKINRVQILNFLFSISFLKIGKAYNIHENLNQVEQLLLEDLSNFGICRKKKEVFYVTPLASEFVYLSSNQGVMSNQWKIPGLHGSIIVQTNFKFYAYTDSAIQISLISLFGKLISRTPNMVVGVIDRDSIRGALMNGITADQIVGYLYIHTHEKTKQLPNPVPLNVAKQIKLWEKERNRIKQTDAFLYDSFSSDYQFNQTLNAVKMKGWLLWCNSKKKLLVVKNVPGENVEEGIRELLIRLNTVVQ